MEVQEALAAAVKEGNRLRADLEYAHSKLDLSSRQLQELQSAANASAEVSPLSASSTMASLPLLPLPDVIFIGVVALHVHCFFGVFILV